MTPSPSDDLIARLTAAEDELRSLAPPLYLGLEDWLDSELYGGLYGAGGVDRLPIEHLPAIRELLRVRADVHRARKVGTLGEFRGTRYDSERGTEFMAQAIDGCLDYLGSGPALPEYKRWDDFLPKWAREE